MKVFNGILFTLFVVSFVGCTESDIAPDTPEFPPGLASALVDEKIISDLDMFVFTDRMPELEDRIVRDCFPLVVYVFGLTSVPEPDISKYLLAEEYLGNGVWKVQLVDSTGKLVAGAFGTHEWNVFERTNTAARTLSAERRVC